ncbi:chitin synthase III catalytic subunit-domain-containing protein [Crepidotus variabilis]|uniref:Chitin synthase export chaperone n=1 Tax=Crepidotus variabilis TaxID=179855 RepID=A0A9P6EE98_9AGAR|nr:chitin synthase III catalytic subunit-domain-containing protein [Crepidotus variabilis]
MGFSFGSFNAICETAALVICPLIGSDQGVEPKCYSRNVDVAGTLLFQPSTCFVHIVAIIMTAIMILHIRSKYTAVGRKEIVMFFWMYAVIELLALFLDSGVIPTSNAVYPWAAAIYTGLVAATYCCLLINGFVGFQFAEDGTPLSLWFLRISCLLIFGVSMFIAIATFKQLFGFNYKQPIALFIIYIIWPLICVPVYIILQLILVFRTLEDRWPIGDIIFGTAFYAGGQVLLFAFSVTICDAIKHYIDGLFFFTLCVLLSVMMVYKYWDSITREDLEFSVGSKAAVWEVKDPLLNGEYEEDNSSDRYTYNSAGGAPPVPPMPPLMGSGGYSSSNSGSSYGFKAQGGYSPAGQKGGRGYPPNGGY